jgi:hypothetical protein
LVEQPIRNRQVSGSSPLVGSILSSTCDQFTATCCTTAARQPASPSRMMMGKTRAAGHYYDEIPLCKMIESLKEWNAQQGPATAPSP